MRVGRTGIRVGAITTGSLQRSGRNLGATLVVASALAACNPGSSGSHEGEPLPSEPPGSTATVSSGGGSSEAPWGPAEMDPDCGCDGVDDGSDATETGSDGTGTGSDGTGTGGDAGLGDGSGDGAGDGAGDGGSGLRLPPTQGRGASSQALVVRLDAAPVSGVGCFHGILADEGGRRIAGALVRAGSMAGARGQGTAVTTRRGHFCIHAAATRAQRCVELGTIAPSAP